MGHDTHIDWCDATWNPWQGCLKVSPGCQHCYMYADHKRYGQDPTQVRRSKTTFNAPLNPAWGKGPGTFTCSWSDWFIEQADAWRPEAWEIIRRTPQRCYLILTKRPERIADHLPEGWPWDHVWLGVSVETPAYLWRADILRSIPAVGRFLSCEPLLADLGTINLDGIGWVIIGGESGQGHRPMAIGWVESLAQQCTQAGVSLFIKQDAGGSPGKQRSLPDALWAFKDRPWETQHLARTDP
jgi:protein gp37